MKLKWQRHADSDGSTIMYTAVADQPAPRQPYYSYRVTPVWSNTYNRVSSYSVTLWHGEREVEQIGSQEFYRRAWMGITPRGEYKLADAKRAAQQHHDNATAVCTMDGSTHTTRNPQTGETCTGRID